MRYPIFLKRKSSTSDALLCAHDNLLTDRLADFLRNQHPVHTAKEVARRAKVSPRTVERWLSGLASPGLPHFLNLLRAYGPALLEAALDDKTAARMKATAGFDWVGRLKTIEDRDKAKADLARVADALRALNDARPNHIADRSGPALSPYKSGHKPGHKTAHKTEI